MSPLPVSAALAPTQPKSSAVTVPDVEEKPLIALDWHKTISHERVEGRSFLPSSNITVLRRLQELGYNLGIASFSSAQETQQAKDFD